MESLMVKRLAASKVIGKNLTAKGAREKPPRPGAYDPLVTSGWFAFQWKKRTGHDLESGKLTTNFMKGKEKKFPEPAEVERFYKCECGYKSGELVNKELSCCPDCNAEVGKRRAGKFQCTSSTSYWYESHLTRWMITWAPVYKEWYKRRKS